MVFACLAEADESASRRGRKLKRAGDIARIQVRIVRATIKFIRIAPVQWAFKNPISKVAATEAIVRIRSDGVMGWMNCHSFEVKTNPLIWWILRKIIICVFVVECVQNIAKIVTKRIFGSCCDYPFAVNIPTELFCQISNDAIQWGIRMIFKPLACNSIAWSRRGD
jgi:hypothetical protein